MKIIGLTGKMGCGKDTAADMIVSEMNYRTHFVKVGFADALKEGMKATFGLTFDEVNDRTLKETPHPKLCGRTPRYVMQMFGTEFARKLIADDIWLKVMEYRIKDIELKGFGSVVISDVRFENEAEFVRSLGGTLWHIERDGNPHITEGSHVSESGVAKHPDDVVIKNNGSLDELYDVIKSILEVK